ncbi:MAG: hypothetical protein ACQEQ4_08825 [Fibrobacterota bacterium]
MKLLCIFLFLCMVACPKNGVSPSSQDDTPESEEYEWSPEDWSEDEDNEDAD